MSKWRILVYTWGIHWSIYFKALGLQHKAVKVAVTAYYGDAPVGLTQLCVVTGPLFVLPVFCFCLARSANLPKRLYILPSVISYFFSFFILGAKLLHRFSRFFHQMEGICVNFLDHVHFFQFFKGSWLTTNSVLYQTRSLGAEVSQDPLDRFAQSLHRMVDSEWQMTNPTFFFRYLKKRCHGNQFSGKNGAKLPTPPALIALSFRNGAG